MKIEIVNVTGPGGDKLLAIIKCVSCGTKHTIEVTEEQIMKYKRGALIQDVFPNMSAGLREMFITGICDNCFDAMDKDEGQIWEDKE